MRQLDNFVDLRVLLVWPDAAENEMLQIAVDDFSFDRITHVSNAESALDQLFFNNFDLVVISGGVSPRAVIDLIDDICDGQNVQDDDIGVLCAFDPGLVAELAFKDSSIQFCPMHSNLDVLRDNLYGAFRRALQQKADAACSHRQYHRPAQPGQIGQTA